MLFNFSNLHMQYFLVTLGHTCCYQPPHMKLPIATILLATFASAASADTYNDNITAIYGGGNPNTGWTSDSANGIELGLRAKNRTSGDTANVNGVYSYATAPAPRGLWNYEFSINSDTSGTAGRSLEYYDFYLAVDRDPTAGVLWSVVNPLGYWGDNSYGNNGTLNGAGTEGTFAALGANNNLAQNSQNITFGDYPTFPQGGLALAPDATYNYELYAVEKGAGSGGPRLVDVAITVKVGNGGAAVPDGGATVLLFGLALAGLAGVRRKLA